MCHKVGINLYLWDKRLHVLNQLHEELPLTSQYLLISTKYLLFILLKFWCDITLCLCQCLLADPIFRNLIFKGITHL